MDKHTDYAWMPESPIEYVYFDVDSTLTSIEGIDELANINQVGDEVKAITQACMSVRGMTIEDYKKRLELVQPTQKQVEQLGQIYLEHITPGGIEVIKILQDLNKKVLILSGGIKQALLPLADKLNISHINTLAVELDFNAHGDYLGFDINSPLVHPHGKKEIIEETHSALLNALLIGDGLSDLEAQSAVTRFIGFGGQGIRQTVFDQSNYYIKTNQLYALLPLCLTYNEMFKLDNDSLAIYKKGMKDILNQNVMIKGQNNV